VLVDLTPGALVVNGTVDYRGDLERLSSWLANPSEPRQWQLGGSLTGTLDAKYSQGVVQATWNTDVEQLSYATAAGAAPRGELTNVSNAPTGGMIVHCAVGGAAREREGTRPVRS
jgi:hypothetical protein